MAYLKEREREAQYEEALRRINPSMTHPSMNAAAQSMNMNNVGAAISGHPMWPHHNSGVGMGAVNQAWPQGGLTAEREVIRNTIKQFTVEKVDNGFILRSGKYSKICKDMEELSQQFIATIVEQQLDK